MTTILIKKKDTAGAPAAGDLTNAAGGAEIAVNTSTKRIYSKDSGGTIIEMGTFPSSMAVQGALSATGNVTLGDASADSVTVNGTIASNLIFTDNTYDIGASGATRPRNLFIAGNITAGGSFTIDGAIDFNNTTDSTSVTTGAVVVDGGVGIAKSLFVGGNATVTKNTATSFLRLQSLAPYSFPGDFTIQAGGQSTPALTITDNTAAQERLNILTGETVFNEAGADQDFRIESDGSPNMFFVDAANNRIGISTNSPQALFNFGSAQDGFLRFDDSRTAVSGTFNSYMSWYSYATANAVAEVGINHNDYFGSTRKFFIKFSGDGPAQVQNRLEMVTGETVFNQDGLDVDFRVESDTNTHMLFVDAGNSRVGVGLSGPNATFHVDGAVNTIVAQVSAPLYENGGGPLSKYLDIKIGNSYIANYSIAQARLRVYGNSWNNSASALEIYTMNNAGSDVSNVLFGQSETVFNENSADVDFRVESDTSTHALWVDASANTVQVNTSTTGFGKLNVYSDGGINQTNWGTAGNSQGNPFNNKIVRWVGSAGSSNKLVIPFLSQGSLNSTTVCRVMGHNAQFNTNSPLGFDFTFAVGHLNALYNLTVWGTGGNYASITTSGMNVEITFTTAYSSVGGEPGGLFLTLEYMSNNPSYSIQSNSIVLA